MKKFAWKGSSFALALAFVIGVFAGCGSQTENSGQTENTPLNGSGVESSNFQNPTPDSSDESESGTQAMELVVRFGDDGDPVIKHLHDNDTAKAIARHVGTADWRLPVYNYGGYENWEVMQ